MSEFTDENGMFYFADDGSGNITVPDIESHIVVDGKPHIFINDRELPECETYAWFESAIQEKAARELQPAQGWVVIEDRLPEERRSKLVYCPQFRNIYCASLHSDGLWYHSGRITYGTVEETVTHWCDMPLPPLPDADK